MKNKIFTGTIIISAAVGLLVFAGSSFAATAPQGAWGQRGGAGQTQFKTGQHNPGVMGVVSNISGSNLVVQSKGFSPNSATTTYSVDASNAAVMYKGATSTLSVIVVGNSISIQGTINGTLIVATKINVGMGFGRVNGQKSAMGPRNASSTIQVNMPEGNGQPIIGGTVSAISGTIITIANKSNISYSIDASTAIIKKGNAVSSLSGIAAGDSVLVQGTINGTSVIATTVNDQTQVASANNSTNSNQKPAGFLGGIKNFFSKLFGF